MIGSTFMSFGKYLEENIYETKYFQENFLKKENSNFKDQ